MPAATASKKKVIIPFGNKILVEVTILTISEGGIELPPGSEEGQVRSGIVKSIGCGVDKDLLKPASPTKDDLSRGLKVGDKVFLPRGTKVGDKFTEEDGKILLVIPPDFITAIIEEE